MGDQTAARQFVSLDNGHICKLHTSYTTKNHTRIWPVRYTTLLWFLHARPTKHPHNNGCGSLSTRLDAPDLFYFIFKRTLVQALRLCTGRTAHRGSGGIALLFHDHGTRRGWGVSVMPRPLFTPEKDPVPIVQEAGWASGPVWTGAENIASTGIRSPDRSARSKSL